jgi:hypothetical protein
MTPSGGDYIYQEEDEELRENDRVHVEERCKHTNPEEPAKY